MKTDIWIVTTTIPERGNPPCLPTPFATEAGAEAYADEMMRAEWSTHGPDDEETGEPLPYPGNWREAQDAILKWSFDGSWGQWQVTQHTIETPDAPNPAAAFIERMAHFTTPEDEFADREFPHTSHYADVEEYISDMSNDRLCGEYSTFMEMVREARQIRDTVDDQHRVTLRDWQCDDNPGCIPDEVDQRPWETSIKTAPERIDIEATHPDGQKCVVWIEVSEGKLVIHAYDSAHDEPANIRISKDSITYDSDRDQGLSLSNVKL